jgi:hypothetical protein
MKIEKLEINLFKVSEIKDDDIVIIKVDEKDKIKFTKDNIESIYNEIKKLIKKDIPIYFFPKSLSVEVMKQHIKNIEKSSDIITNNENKLD